ncbi:PTR2-domain-containing protein [Schizopora paradoxa]|uniref:PTR2-domain-containing protein n=1 Tax=Schizopora paradoxa TaxID=27342 RepID=A0A0H2RRS5_9AGAM|nr:PTR2-domain-containing protein [Schizopora paradoxa]
MGVQSIVKDLIQSRSHAESEVTYIPLTDTSVLPAEASHISDGRVEFQLGVDSSTDEDDDGDTLANGELEVDDLEKEKLRRVSDAIPIAAFTIVLVEFCERFAFYGLSGVFQNYLQNPLPPGGNGAGAPASPSDPYPAGALGLGQGTATTLNNSFGFLAYALSIVGAVIADAYWGRYKTISSCCFVYVIGLVVITFTSFPSLLAGGFGLMGWIVGVIIVAIGTGGIKANVSPLVADQYRKTTSFPRTLPSGERVLVDPTITITRIYSLFYWCINVGALAALVTTQLERRIGFWAAFSLPTVVFLGTPLILILGRNLYYKVPPSGSIILDAVRVVRIVIINSWRKFRGFHIDVGDVWDLAKPSFAPRSAWFTWDDDFVVDVRQTLRACQVAAFLPIYWSANFQLGTNLVSMASTMRTDGVPNDLLQNINPLSLICLIPVFDMWIYPTLRKRGLGALLAPIPRITLGFFIAASAMVYAAILQSHIYGSNDCGEYVSSCSTTSTITVWAQAPCYALVAISEIFASITSLEYAYNKAPPRMKSVVIALFLLASAFGNLINIGLAPLARDPFLVVLFTSVAILTSAAGCLFYYCFRDRD